MPCRFWRSAAQPALCPPSLPILASPFPSLAVSMPWRLTEHSLARTLRVLSGGLLVRGSSVNNNSMQGWRGPSDPTMPSGVGCMVLHTGLDKALIADVFLRRKGLGLELQAAPLLVCGGARNPKLGWRERQYQSQYRRSSRPHQWLSVVPATPPCSGQLPAVMQTLHRASFRVPTVGSVPAGQALYEPLELPAAPLMLL